MAQNRWASGTTHDWWRAAWRRSEDLEEAVRQSRAAPTHTMLTYEPLVFDSGHCRPSVPPKTQRVTDYRQGPAFKPRVRVKAITRRIKQ